MTVSVAPRRFSPTVSGPDGLDGPSTASSRRQATLILTLLYASLVLSYVDRAVFALSLKPIKEALALSDSQLGLLSGVAFAASYALLSPVAGRLGDRWSRKAVLMMAVSFWSLATVATAFSGHFWSMVAARACVGAGEAAVMPLAVSLLSDTRPEPVRRHRAFSAFLSAGIVGNMSGLLFGGAVMRSAPRIAGLAAWQGVFVVAGAAGLLLILAIGVLMVDPPHATPSTAARTGTRIFVRDHAGLMVTLYGGVALLQAGLISTLGWILIVLERTHGWSAGEAGVRFALTGGVAAIIGAFATGPMIRHVEARGSVTAPLTVCLATSACFAVAVALGAVATSPMLSLTLIAVGFFFALAPTACAFAVMAEALPSPIRAGLAGLNTLFNAVLCNSLAVFLVGALSDHVFHAPAGVAQSLAIVNLLTFALGAVVTLAGRRGYARHMMSMAGARGRASPPFSSLSDFRDDDAGDR